MWLIQPESESHSVVSNSLWPHRLYSPWNSPGQNTGMGSQPFPSPGDSQPRDWTQVSRIAGRFFTSWATREAPKWVAYPFSSGSSWNRNLFIFKSYNIFSVLKLKKKKNFWVNISWFSTRITVELKYTEKENLRYNPKLTQDCLI